MFTKETAEKTARQLEVDWNSMQLDDFLNYFTDDVELLSTNIQRFVSESNGRLNGKETLRNYWIYTREKFPYFKYKLHHVDFEGDRLILTFFNSIDNTYSHGVLSFNEEGKVYKMMVSYV